MEPLDTPNHHLWPRVPWMVKLALHISVQCLQSMTYLVLKRSNSLLFIVYDYTFVFELHFNVSIVFQIKKWTKCCLITCDIISVIFMIGCGQSVVYGYIYTLRIPFLKYCGGQSEKRHCVFCQYLSQTTPGRMFPE